MKVREFFEKFASVMCLHKVNKSTSTNTMRIKIYDGGGMSGGHFTATGEFSLRGQNTIADYEFITPFANTFLGKQIGAIVKTVPVCDLTVKNWKLEEFKEDMNQVLLLTIEIDNNIK